MVTLKNIFLHDTYIHSKSIVPFIDNDNEITPTEKKNETSLS
jgi:hypothetical protein